MIQWITRPGVGWVSITAFDTHWGPAGLVHRAGGVLAFAFGEAEAGALLDELRKNWPGAVEESGGLPGLQAALRRYFNGEPAVSFDCAVDVSWARPFTRAVLKRCAAIPAGRTVTYRELAGQAGSPGAARGVGQVMARNPVPIIIPCHRVVTAGGGLGGYSTAGGPDTKRALLEYERSGTAGPLTSYKL